MSIDSSIKMYHFFLYQTTGNRIAPQHIKSTRMNISLQVLRSISPSSLSAIMISATFAKICNSSMWKCYSLVHEFVHSDCKEIRTCSGITIINSFLSLSAKMCLINVQPVPISTMVMNSTAPFNLQMRIM